MKINLLEVWKGCCHIKMKEHNDRICLFFRDICLSWKGLFFLVAETRHYHVLSRHFSLSLRRSTISPLYQIRIGGAPPDRHTSFLNVTLHLIVPRCTTKNLARQEMSFGRSPTVILSSMAATLCLSPNFSPSGSGCIVSFSPVVDPVDNVSLE